MKHFFHILLLLFLLITTQAQRSKKALFIIADGIPADVMERVPHPNLEAVAKAGGYARAYVGGEKGGYSQTPTISAVSYNSLLTGTWVNKHNVGGNDIKAPNYHYATIFRLFKQQYPQKTTAIFSTWTDNRTRLIGEGLSETDHLMLDYKFDSYELDTITYPHDKQSNYIHQIDEKVANEAAGCIREKGPDLSWVYLEYTDDMGHRYGNSKQLDQTVMYMDDQVGRMMQAVNYRQKEHQEDWEIFITTDHGRDSITGKSHGGQSDRERTTWMFTNAKELNSKFKNDQPAITDILPTIARHLNVIPDTAVAFELDGTPLTGILSLVNPEAFIKDDSLFINWTSVFKHGYVKLWLSTTNYFKTGGKDAYQLLAEMPVAIGHYQLAISELVPSSFYKIALQAPYNTANRWIVIKAKD